LHQFQIDGSLTPETGGRQLQINAVNYGLTGCIVAKKHSEFPPEREALMRAIKEAGGLRELAEHLGISKQAVHQWKDRIPADYIVTIEHVTGVLRQELRPDLYQGMRRR
jgi:Bacterial toxin YdaS